MAWPIFSLRTGFLVGIRGIRHHTKVRRAKGFQVKDFKNLQRHESGYDLVEELTHASVDTSEYTSLNALPTLLYRQNFEKEAKTQEFQLGPKSPIFKSDTVYLRMFQGETEVLPRIDLKKTNFLEMITSRYDEFKNHVEFVRGAHGIEVLGRSLVREIIYAHALYNYRNPGAAYTSTIKNITRKYSIRSHSLYFDCNTTSSPMAEMEKFFNFTKYRALSILYIYLGLKYLEDPKGAESIIKKLISEFTPSPTPRKLRGKGQGTADKFVNSFRDKFMEYSKDDKEDLRTVNSSIIFRQTFRPKLFPNSGRLPPIPFLSNPSQSNILLNIALINPGSGLLSQKALRNKLITIDIGKKLDKLGDLVLRRLIMEYIFINSTKRVGLLSDYHFLNSNVVFGRLTEVYSLHKGLENKAHQDEFLEILKNSTNLKKLYERVGDFFERLVAVLYIDNQDRARKWVFDIMDVVTSTMAKETDNGRIYLEKEKFVDLVEQHGFYYDRSAHFNFKASQSTS
ncbi:uncharacterized protein RJT20DRAFT_123725 [Scheffersomyces xylosifermentans]|uniref:uncharacterized protein n=1 Tax=Scheffersomyces xylosifermentans TaxID=1304137 RepID=UPI00315D1591